MLKANTWFPITYVYTILSTLLSYYFRLPDHCNNLGTGDKQDRDKDVCLSGNPFGERKPCDFEKTKELFGIDKCFRPNTEGIALRFQCATSEGGKKPLLEGFIRNISSSITHQKTCSLCNLEISKL